jgi:hypothetical protein
LRAQQEAKESAASVLRRQEIARKQRELERRRTATAAQIAALQAEMEAVELESTLIAAEDESREQKLRDDRATMARRRGGSAQAKANR